MRHKQEHEPEIEDVYKHIPKTLVVNPDGEPLRWVNYSKYAYYQSKNSIVWTLGKQEYIIRGGINSKTNEQSKLIIESIIAVRNDSGKRRKFIKPALTNAALFSRDDNMCAYCGHTFSRVKLTRDHIIPQSKGGPDTWENCVTCCFECNQRKGNHLLQDIPDMDLLYQPYAPSHHENLILRNKKLSKDQLEYLIIGVSKHSRVYKDYLKRKAQMEVEEKLSAIA